MGMLMIWAWITLVAFGLGVLYKAIRYASMPAHVRWELYPVAHEKGRVSYGGSYFEDVDWWTRPREVSKLGEVKTIAEEVLTLKAVRENNPPIWLASLSFHFGLYLLFTLGLALLVGALCRVAGWSGLGFLAGGPVLAAWGGVGIALAILGCVLLLGRRLFLFELRRASTPADFLHLWMLLAVFLASAASWMTADRSFAVAAGFLERLISFRSVESVPFWFAAQIVLLGIFLAYLPWSHMTHFFAKYFTWHSVRWDDAPNVQGKVFAEKTGSLLLLPIHWSAPHIRGGGGKTWADAATEEEEN